MLWRPISPVYPRLVKRVPDGLTLEEANELRKRGRDIPPILKLGTMYTFFKFSMFNIYMLFDKFYTQKILILVCNFKS